MRGLNSILHRLKATWKSLVVNKLRTVLTLLGIVIGISSVIILMSLGDSVKDYVNSQVTSLGANNLTVTPGGSFEAGTLSRFDEKDLETVKSLTKNIESQISWQSTARVSVSYSGVEVSTTSLGIPQSFWEMGGVNVGAGREINDDDISQKNLVTVLGSSISQELFGSEDALGKKIKLGNNAYTVIGVLEEGSRGLSNNDNNVIVPISTLQTYISGNKNISQIIVQIANKDNLDSVEKKLEQYLRVARGIQEGEDSDFSISSLSSVLDTFNSIISTLTLFLAAIAAISLIVGGIGIMNIMFVSVSERTKEIGLRKSLGANNSDILSQFLLEAVFVTLLGGIIGALIGAGFTILITKLFSLSTIISPSSVLLALGVSAFIGIVFGIYPARRASLLTPIDALRYE